MPGKAALEHTPSHVHLTTAGKHSRRSRVHPLGVFTQDSIMSFIHELQRPKKNCNTNNIDIDSHYSMRVRSGIIKIQFQERFFP